ncbi:MAG: lipoate--protein ligase family protein [Planctomycetes bacterium]|nr:lipoate--protein ligase family protein [Planctomycetota bacterium]
MESSSANPAIRVLSDPASDGPANMARDEALLECVGRRAAPPTLRLYQWDPPTVSLGYFQPYAEFAALPPPAGSLAVVRRLTGGGAILHDQELTYSLVLPANHALLSTGPRRLYELMHEAVAAALSGLGVSAAPCGQSDDSSPTRGPFFCFARRHACDLLVGEAKIAGSAQRRTRQAVLQHGSIVLAARFGQQPAACTPGTIAENLARIRADLPGQVARVASLRVEEGAWTDDELALATALAAKYAGTDWTRRC